MRGRGDYCSQHTHEHKPVSVVVVAVVSVLGPARKMAKHICGGIWINSPPVSPTKPCRTSPSGPLLGRYLQDVYAEDQFRDSTIPAAYWQLQQIIQDENPSLAIVNGSDLHGLELIMWLLDTQQGAKFLKRRTVLQLLHALWTQVENGELKRLVGDALNCAVEHGQEAESAFNPNSAEAHALELCVIDDPTAHGTATYADMLTNSGLELLFHWWLFGDEGLQLAAARAISIVQGRTFDPANSICDHALNLALQPREMQAQVIEPNRHKFSCSSIFPWLCSLYAGKTQCPPAARSGAAQAIGMITGRNVFDPTVSAVDDALLHEMISLFEYCRPHTAVGERALTFPRRRCLVLGVGDIGRPVCHALRAKGHEVVAVARFSCQESLAELQDAGVNCIPLDLNNAVNPANVAADLPDNIDLVFVLVCDPAHLEAQQPDANWKLHNNAIGDVVRKYAGRADIIHGSTGSVYGEYKQHRSNESDEMKPQSEYASAKTAQEQLIDTVAATVSNSRVLHLRFFNSESVERGVLRNMAESILRGESLGQLPDQQIQLIAQADAVRCTLEAAELVADEPIVVNICHPKVWTMEELAQHIALEMGSLMFGNGHVCGPSYRGLNSEQRAVVRFNPCGHTFSQTTSLVGDPTEMIRHFGEPRESVISLIREVCHDVIMEVTETEGF